MVDKFFHPKVHTGWSKKLKPETRRAKVLKAHKGDVLASARGLQSLSNVTKDKVTAQKAGVDARYFFKRYDRENK